MKIDYFTNIFSHYRFPIWKLLINSEDLDFSIYYSPKSIDEIKTVKMDLIKEDSKKKLFPVLKNFFFFNKLIWQKGVIYKVLNSKAEAFVFLGEMTIISTWISIFICKIRKKKIFFWGHGLYGNENTFKLSFRIFFLKLADVNFLYGNWAKNILLKNGFKENELEVIYNSLPSTSIKLKEKNHKINEKNYYFRFKENDILFVGRLNKKKGIELIIKAIEYINSGDLNVRLVIIGEGDYKLEIIKKFNLLIDKSIFFLGEIYDEQYLKYCFNKSKLLVSPGNVGLACIHSLSYGTPVCTHNDMNYQMPEAEILNDENSSLFEKGNFLSLVNAIKKGIILKTEKQSRKIIQSVFECYTPENQFQRIHNKIIKSI